MKWWIITWALLSGLNIFVLYLFRNVDKDAEEKIHASGNILLLTILVILGVLIFNE